MRELAGRAMVLHVCDRARESGAREVIVATDDLRIVRAVEEAGMRALLTAADHQSGTDRLAEVVEREGYGDDHLVVNLQGDEPLMPGDLVAQVAEDLAHHPEADVATLCEPITLPGDLFDPHVVKVVTDRAGYALYFSRAPIPWDRDAFIPGREVLSSQAPHFRHVGLYAYRCGFLRRYMAWPRCDLEKMESLEQLRVLWAGGRIHVATARVTPGHGVDTPEDLSRAEVRLRKGVSGINGP